VASCIFAEKLKSIAVSSFNVNKRQLKSIAVNQSQTLNDRKRGKQYAHNRKSQLQDHASKGNRIQIPELIRWQFKVETNQMLNIGVNDQTTQSSWQFFYEKMKKDGRILIPLLIIKLLQENG
jgi:hypothetical protein